MTKIKEILLAEFDEEMAGLRKMLERVPDDKFGWRSHEKSSTLGKLANHLALLPMFVAVVLNGQGRKPPEAGSRAELLAALDGNVAAGREALARASDEQLFRQISIAGFSGTTVVALLRTPVMSHMVHHRGQLSVYLRLLDQPVPGVYGPSADDKV